VDGSMFGLSAGDIVAIVGIKVGKRVEVGFCVGLGNDTTNGEFVV